MYKWNGQIANLIRMGVGRGVKCFSVISRTELGDEKPFNIRPVPPNELRPCSFHSPIPAPHYANIFPEI